MLTQPRESFTCNEVKSQDISSLQLWARRGPQNHHSLKPIKFKGKLTGWLMVRAIMVRAIVRWDRCWDDIIPERLKDRIKKNK